MIIGGEGQIQNMGDFFRYFASEQKVQGTISYENTASLTTQTEKTVG